MLILSRGICVNQEIRIIYPCIDPKKVRENIEAVLSQSPYKTTSAPEIKKSGGFFPFLFGKQDPALPAPSLTHHVKVEDWAGVPESVLDALIQIFEIPSSTQFNMYKAMVKEERLRIPKDFLPYILMGFDEAQKKLISLSGGFPINEDVFELYLTTKEIQIFDPFLEYRPFAVSQRKGWIDAQDLYTEERYHVRSIPIPELDGFSSPAGPLGKGERNPASIISLALSTSSWRTELPPVPGTVVRKPLQNNFTPDVLSPEYITPFSAKHTLSRGSQTQRVRISKEEEALIDWVTAQSYYTGGAIIADALDGQMIDLQVGHQYFYREKKEGVQPCITIMGSPKLLSSLWKPPEKPPYEVEERRTEKKIWSALTGVAGISVVAVIPPLAAALGAISGIMFLGNLKDYSDWMSSLEKQWVQSKKQLGKMQLKTTYP